MAGRTVVYAVGEYGFECGCFEPILLFTEWQDAIDFVAKVRRYEEGDKFHIKELVLNPDINYDKLPYRVTASRNKEHKTRSVHLEVEKIPEIRTHKYYIDTNKHYIFVCVYASSEEEAEKIAEPLIQEMYRGSKC